MEEKKVMDIHEDNLEKVVGGVRIIPKGGTEFYRCRFCKHDSFVVDGTEGCCYILARCRNCGKENTIEQECW